MGCDLKVTDRQNHVAGAIRLISAALIPPVHRSFKDGVNVPPGAFGDRLHEYCGQAAYCVQGEPSKPCGRPGHDACDRAISHRFRAYFTRPSLRANEDAIYVTSFSWAILDEDAVDVWSIVIENQAQFLSFHPFFSMARQLIGANSETATKALWILADSLGRIEGNRHFGDVHKLLDPKIDMAFWGDGFLVAII
jgi:hypothetical protein